MKPGETGCSDVVAFRFKIPNLRWMDCAHVWCRSIDLPCSFSSVQSCSFTKAFAIEIVILYVMECPEARMLLIMLITFASISRVIMVWVLEDVSAISQAFHTHSFPCCML